MLGATKRFYRYNILKTSPLASNQWTVTWNNKLLIYESSSTTQYYYICLEYFLEKWEYLHPTFGWFCLFGNIIIKSTLMVRTRRYNTEHFLIVLGFVVGFLLLSFFISRLFFFSSYSFNIKNRWDVHMKLTL